ncbi:MAG: mobilization protein [Chitinophagaceae bacterium]
MEAEDIKKSSKGGRPPKTIKRNHFIGVKCSLIEKKMIEAYAKNVGLTLSEYLRETGLKGHADRKIKALPKEVLSFTGTLNHMAANLNQLAKKRNQFDVLDAIERADLNILSASIKKLAEQIKLNIP